MPSRDGASGLNGDQPALHARGGPRTASAEARPCISGDGPSPPPLPCGASGAGLPEGQKGLGGTSPCARDRARACSSSAEGLPRSPCERPEHEGLDGTERGRDGTEVQGQAGEGPEHGRDSTAVQGGAVVLHAAAPADGRAHNDGGGAEGGEARPGSACLGGPREDESGEPPQGSRVLSNEETGRGLVEARTAGKGSGQSREVPRKGGAGGTAKQVSGGGRGRTGVAKGKSGAEKGQGTACGAPDRTQKSIRAFFFVPPS